MLENVQIRPHLVFLGEDKAQVEKIKTLPGTSLSGKYFLFMTSAGVKHYAWLNTGASVDPAPAGGWTENEVAILAGDSASAVATKIAAVLTAIAGFDATASGDVITLTHTANGYAQPARDGEGVGATSFAFSIDTLGAVEREAGCIAGNIEISGFEQTKVEVKCHDTGATVQKEIVSGYSNPELALTFQETDKDSIKQFMVDIGMTTFTPVGVDKKEVFGYGANQVGKSNPRMFVRLHPVDKDTTDRDEDWNIWTAEMNLDSLVLSGEEVSTVPATLKMYPDQVKPKEINFFMIGDKALAGY